MGVATTKELAAIPSTLTAAPASGVSDRRRQMRQLKSHTSKLAEALLTNREFGITGTAECSTAAQPRGLDGRSTVGWNLKLENDGSRRSIRSRSVFGGRSTCRLDPTTLDGCQISGCRHNTSSVADHLRDPRPERGGGGHPRASPVSVGRPRTAQGRPRGLNDPTVAAALLTRSSRMPRPVVGLGPDRMAVARKVSRL